MGPPTLLGMMMWTMCHTTNWQALPPVSQKKGLDASMSSAVLAIKGLDGCWMEMLKVGVSKNNGTPNNHPV